MILHIITSFSGSAGAETMLARLLRVSHEDRIVVAPLIAVSDRNRLLADNPRVTYAPQGADTVLRMGLSIPKLAALIRAESPRVVLCWMYHAMVAGTLAGYLARSNAPIFWNVRQSLDDPSSLTRSTRTALYLSRLLSNTPAGIIYNSMRAKDLHSHYGYRNPNTTVIPNGFEIVDSAAPATKTPRVFGIAGRFHPQKDYETFFGAAALTAQSHPHARFMAAGAGMSSENPLVSKLIERTGLARDAVELCGQVDNMAEFYREIDVLVLSSRTEGFPNVVAEAMSYGKPVVTTDVGDAAAIIGGDGIVVPPRNLEALAGAMRNMLDLSPADYTAMATAAKSRIERDYALPEIARRYDEFLGLTR